ncbi:hypothetical protein FJTKL_06390 [Diaporthe vaccinii]|uniref:Uncharacterized protein n=1 Tax=Diaporthe vaccinii TaxID=105482 RepID=A0ABR4EWP5_9PEZI
MSKYGISFQVNITHRFCPLCSLPRYSPIPATPTELMFTLFYTILCAKQRFIPTLMLKNVYVKASQVLWAKVDDKP